MENDESLMLCPETFCQSKLHLPEAISRQCRQEEFRVYRNCLGFGVRVNSVRAVGAPFTLGIGAHPLIARLRQHVVPPQPPQLFSIRV